MRIEILSDAEEYLHGESRYAGPGNSRRRACLCRDRVPVKSLFDHLEAGDSIADFIEGFPSVKREQVIALLEKSKAHAMANQ
jgi:uncharacterized protein (DUF433 family)